MRFEASSSKFSLIVHLFLALTFLNNIFSQLETFYSSTDNKPEGYNCGELLNYLARGR